MPSIGVPWLPRYASLSDSYTSDWRWFSSLSTNLLLIIDQLLIITDLCAEKPENDCAACNQKRFSSFVFKKCFEIENYLNQSSEKLASYVPNKHLGPNWEPPLIPLEHHHSMVPRDLRRAFICVPVMSRGASLSDSRCKIFQSGEGNPWLEFLSSAAWEAHFSWSHVEGPPEILQ